MIDLGLLPSVSGSHAAATGDKPVHVVGRGAKFHQEMTFLPVVNLSAKMKFQLRRSFSGPPRSSKSSSDPEKMENLCYFFLQLLEDCLGLPKNRPRNILLMCGLRWVRRSFA